jgi:hypothetical protein
MLDRTMLDRTMLDRTMLNRTMLNDPAIAAEVMSGGVQRVRTGL